MKFLVAPVEFKRFFTLHAESCTGIYCDGLRFCAGKCFGRLGCYLM